MCIRDRTKFGAKLTLTTSDDTDIVQMVKLDTKAISVDTGDSTDILILADILAGGAVSVKTGSAIDQLQVVGLIQSGSGANVFDLGSDTDVLLLAQSSFAAATTIDLGSGLNNTVSIDDVSFNSTFTPLPRSIVVAAANELCARSRTSVSDPRSKTFAPEPD